MCSLALLLSLVVTQDTTLARLRARADSLAVEWRRTNAFADVADSLERERAAAGRDTIAVGALRIIANPSPLPLREAAQRLWPMLDSLYGAASQTLATRPYFIRGYDPDTTARRPRLRVGFDVPWNLDVDQLTDLLLANVPIAPPDSGLGAWLGAPIRPALRPAQERTRVYIRLVTAPSAAARRCFLGDVAGCAAALDLGASEDPFRDWYPSALERRALVMRSFAEYFNRAATTTTLRACVAGSDTACTGLLRSLSRGAIPRPLDVDARRTLIATALRLGGREAYGRLLADPGSAIGARLTAAAGVELDTLLGRWRSEVLAARPAPVALPQWAAWAAFVWAAVFAGCGLRSSRWRVG